MNAKKAKWLRSLTRKSYLGLRTYRAGQPEPVPYIMHPQTGVITCHPQTYRGLYRMFKKEMK